ncbi:HNH endonuclease [Paenibacillus sp. GYB004]|uniref:HNH endonuclease n=1 Tax=Paenibacillus sp. GYB004 TaxID=2994393 RepID=UPI003FA73321
MRLQNRGVAQVKEIDLPHGYVTIIDDEDYSLASKYSWYLLKQRSKVYTYGSIVGSGERIYLHRLILNAPPDKLVDHINGNGLDNRKCNLRLCTHQQNSWNSNIGRGSSKYRGVNMVDSGIWSARIKDSRGSVELGKFSSEYEAAMVYDIAAKLLRGEFSKPNIPDAAYSDSLFRKVLFRIKRLHLLPDPPVETKCFICGTVFGQVRWLFVRNQLRGSVNCCSRSCRAIHANSVRHHAMKSR